MKTICTYIAIIFLFSSCLVSRLSRPALTGVIVDFNKNPIANCAVGETFTDESGKFSLEEKRYRQFIVMVLEAPSLYVSVFITKEGYKTKVIHSFSRFGGGARKGAKWELDTIYLNNMTQEVNLNKLLHHQWKLSTSKKLDTLFLIKKNFNEICKTRACKDFYYDYNSYTENIWNSKRNLPDGVIRRAIDIDFLKNDTFLAQIISEYDEKGNHLAERTKPNDTITINGRWRIANNSLELTSARKELNGKFNFNEVDYEYIKLTK